MRKLLGLKLTKQFHIKSNKVFSKYFYYVYQITNGVRLGGVYYLIRGSLLVDWEGSL